VVGILISQLAFQFTSSTNEYYRVNSKSKHTNFYCILIFFEQRNTPMGIFRFSMCVSNQHKFCYVYPKLNLIRMLWKSLRLFFFFKKKLRHKPWYGYSERVCVSEFVLIWHTHRLSLSISLSLCLLFSVLLSHTHTLSLSHAHAHTLSHTLSLSHTHTLSVSLSPPHTHEFSLSLTHSLSRSHTPSFSCVHARALSLYIFISHTLSLSHTQGLGISIRANLQSRSGRMGAKGF